MPSPRTVRALLVLAAFISALTLRCAFSYHTVFRAGEVAIQDPDAAFHVRTIQNLVRHFPYRSGADPYSGFPRGQNIDTGPFHDYAIGTVAWVAGWGAPSRHLTDVIAAWFPAWLGALMVIPVYFLGRNLFSPVAGLIAAGVIAILPGTFLWVTRLGNPDHHATEALLSTILLLVLVKALQANSPWRLVVLAGLVFGSYLSTQAAGAFLVFFVNIWAILQVCMNHLRGQGSRQIWIVTVPPLLMAWPIFILAGPTVWSNMASLVIFCGIVTISGAVALSEVLHSRLRFFAALLGGLASGALAFILLKPDLAKAAMAIVTDRGSDAAQTVGELRPLLTSLGSFSLVPAWTQFTTCWFLAPIALAYLGWRAMKTNLPSHLLFATWSTLMMAASFLHTRNCVYLAPSMALLSGFACTHFLRLERRYERIVAGLLVGAALLVPNVSLAYPFVSTDTGISEEWRSALAFLRHETPEPFGDPTAFDRYFPRLAEGSVFPYPQTAYGILNWWDFGHWISAYGRRIPIANGMQTGAGEAARFFTATDPAQGEAILRQTGARYVIADSSLPMGAGRGSGSFAAMATWAGLKEDKFWEEYVGAAPGGEVASFPVFYPAYYQSMLARLYLFDGQPQTPAGSTWVIQYSREKERGQIRKRLQSSQRFGTYEEADRYVREHPGLSLVIGGLSPVQSCVPLPPLDRYRWVYNPQPRQVPAGEPVSSVKIFQFAP